MHLKKLTPSFYSNNTHLIQALDLKNGVWIRGKERGYGIVVIEINNLMFGIPLRSNIKHKAAYLTKRRNHGETNKGLDFSKAVLLEYRFYVSDFDFKIPPNEHSKLIGKEVFFSLPICVHEKCRLTLGIIIESFSLPICVHEKCRLTLGIIIESGCYAPV
jgi:protein AbiQ